MNKTITSKISVLLLLTLFAFQVQGQALWTTNGTYKLSTSGVTPVLYMTIDNDANLVWAEELPNDNASQVWTVKGHRYAATAHDGGNGSGYMEITATIPGAGTFTMATNATSTDVNNLTIIARPGLPIDNTDDLTDLSGLDQFQRRKTKVDANGLASSTGTNPTNGNNALFLRTPWSNGARHGVVPSAVGDPVKFDGGGIDVLQFHLIAALSTEDFDTSSVFISNPVNNELNIEGLTANVKQVSVYSLLGKQVLSKNVNQQATLSFDVSALSSGMYLVKMQGDKGSFVHKIVKQ